MGLHIKKIQIGSPPVEYFLVTESEEKRWKLNLISVEQRKVFCSDVSERELRLIAAECPITTFDIFLSDTLCAFGCEEPDEHQNIHYFLKNEGGTMKFEWKKDMSEGVRVQLGELEFSEKEFNAAMIDVLSMTASNLVRNNRKIQELKADATKKEKERSATQSVLDETLKSKANLEIELFTKFANVLNCKKQKIRELCAEIASTKTSQKSKKLPLSSKPSKVNRNEDLMEVDDINQPGPSKKKDSQELFLSSEEEEQAPKPAPKLRQRVCKKTNVDATHNGRTKPNISRPLAKKSTALVDCCDEDDIDGMFDIL